MAEVVTQGDEREHVVAPPLLEVRKLRVDYGQIAALHDVSVCVAQGAVVALLGANGAGKTTTLRSISGLLGFHNGRIAGGEIVFDGAPLVGSAAGRVSRGIAQVMEGRRIFSELTIEDNLIAGAFTVSSKSKRSAAYDRVFELFPLLAERRGDIAGYLSGGQQQILAIGRALMSGPRLLLLDEPSLGLAPLVVEQIGQAIGMINRAGTAVLLVEQNASVALGLSSEAVILETGRVALSGSSEQLKADPKVRDVYLGMSGHKRRSYRDTHNAERNHA